MRVNRLSFLSALRVFTCIVCGVFVIESASLSLFERMTVAAEVEEAEAPKLVPQKYRRFRMARQKNSSHLPAVSAKTRCLQEVAKR